MNFALKYVEWEWVFLHEKSSPKSSKPYDFSQKKGGHVSATGGRGLLEKMLIDEFILTH